MEALLGRPVEPLAGPKLQARGWPSLLQSVPTIVRHLHYQTDADALVVVADSNHTALEGDGSRLVALAERLKDARERLSPVPERAPLRIAVGLAVPCLEAWLLIGREKRVNEPTWENGLKTKKDPFRKSWLKQKVYGTERPNLDLSRERAAEEATRVAGEIGRLEKHFPVGFGHLAREVRSWAEPR